MAGLEERLLLAILHCLGHHHWGVGVCQEFLLLGTGREKRYGSTLQGTVVFSKDLQEVPGEVRLAAPCHGDALSFRSSLAAQIFPNLPCPV